MGSVAVLGSLNMDTSVEVHRFPAPGETVAARHAGRRPGGKGLNQAVAAARMGARVSMLGAVGDDASGRELIRVAGAEAGLDLSRVSVVSDVDTGQAIVTVDEHGENEIIVIAGANGLDDADAIARSVRETPEAEVFVCQLELPLPVVAAGLRSASARGSLTVLNAAPAGSVHSLMADVDLLVVNESEARALLDDETVTADRYAAELRRRFGVDSVVTLGDRGVLWASADGEGSAPAFAVDVVDTTGAGDAFVGALAAFLSEGSALDRAVTLAAAAGAFACTSPGAQGYVQRRDDVLRRAASATPRARLESDR